MANRTNRNAYKEATVNNRRSNPGRRSAVARRTAVGGPVRRTASGRPGRPSARRAGGPVSRSAARRPVAPRPAGRVAGRPVGRRAAARSVAPRRVAGRPVAPTLRTAARPFGRPASRPAGRVAGRNAVRPGVPSRSASRRPVISHRPAAPVRRPVVAGRPARRPAGRLNVARRSRTAGFVPGTRVVLTRQATRTRRPVELRVVASKGGRFIGQERNGQRWEFVASEVSRVARMPRRADMSTMTDIPDVEFPAPAPAVADVEMAPEADLYSPSADADGTGPDWQDDPRDLHEDSGTVYETSPTAEEYSGDADDPEVPVAGVDEDITVDGNVRGLVDEDTGTSTDIPDDATEVTASRKTEARFFAAQRLAQMKVDAGVEQGDPVVIGHKLVASKMSLGQMQAEIETLDRVIAARGSVDEGPVKVAKDRKGGLVPRTQNRTVPSMVAQPSAPVADAGDDFALFE